MSVYSDHAPTRFRWAVTHVLGGLRVLTTPAQGRCLWDDKGAAEDWAAAVVANPRFDELYGKGVAETVKVREVECWDKPGVRGAFGLTIDADDLDPFEEFDCYGKIAQGLRGDRGPVRPREFDGRARIIDRNQRPAVWWSPGEHIEDEHVEDAFRIARAILEHGMVQVGVRYVIGTDATHRNVIGWQTWVGGVDPEEAHENSSAWREHLRELAVDLLAEFRSELGIEDIRAQIELLPGDRDVDA